MEKEIDFGKPEYFENRELSWIKFDRRVLNEARDKRIPLLERLKFVSITSSNLDEFFMVRVASLKDIQRAGVKTEDIAGLNASKQLERINRDVKELVNLQYSTYNRSLLPLLNQEHIYIIDAYEKLTEEQAAFVDDYFEKEVYPVLTPMAVDSGRPFPLISNKTLNIAAVIQSKGGGLLGHDKHTKEAKPEFATVQVPAGLARLVPVPSKNPEDKVFILLEQVIEKNLDKLFSNYKVECAYPYRIMRDADFSIDEDEAPDLLKEIQKQLKKRKWGEVIRLEVEEGIDKKLLSFLKEELHIENKHDIFYMNGPIDFTFLMKM